MGVRYSKHRHKSLRISKAQIPWLLRGAIRSNNVETLQYLFSYPNKVDPSMVIDGVCPLNLAVELGYLQMVRILLKAGADIYVADAPRYPLHQASLFGRAAIAEQLIRLGASVSAMTGNRQSCLHLLAHQSTERFLETANVLLHSASNPNTLDDNGLAPLHLASVEMVHLFVTYDQVDVNICSRDGDTPLLAAVKDRRESVVNAILQANRVYQEQIGHYPQPPSTSPSTIATPTKQVTHEGHTSHDPGITTVRTVRSASAKWKSSTLLPLLRPLGMTSKMAARAKSVASVVSVSVNTSAIKATSCNRERPPPRAASSLQLGPSVANSPGECAPPFLSLDPNFDGGGLNQSECQSSPPPLPGNNTQYPRNVRQPPKRVSSQLLFGLTVRKTDQLKRCQRWHSVGNSTDISGWLHNCARLQPLLTVKINQPASTAQRVRTTTNNSPAPSTPKRCGNGAANQPTIVRKPRAPLDLERTDRLGMTALLVAAEAGNAGLAMTMALVHAGANLLATDKTGMTALHHACYVGSLSSVRFLLELHCQRPSMETCENAPQSVIATAPSSTSLALIYSSHCRWGSSGLVDVQDKYGRTPIYLAACRGHVQVVNYLLGQGANFHIANKECKSPLYISAYFGYLDIANALLRCGAQVDQTDSHRKTPLYVATYHGRSDIVDILLDAGANVNAADKNGKTPLYVVVLHGHLSLAAKLLAVGASVNRVDREGLGPLHMAVKFPKLDIPMVKLLLNHGCDPVNLASFTRWLLEHGIIPDECIHGDVELAQWLHGEECNVRSLKRICRVAIQQALGNGDSMRSKLHRLPLPEHVVSYLSMREL